MINREDMLELTRRMTPARNCFDRIAGAYMNDMGEGEERFNIHFGKLSGSETARNLELAKAIPFSKTNVQLKEYDFPDKAKGKDKENLWESEEIYDFMICAICPLCGEYEPAAPEFGFLYPAFSDRSGEQEKIDIFHANPEKKEEGLLYKLFGKN